MTRARQPLAGKSRRASPQFLKKKINSYEILKRKKGKKWKKKFSPTAMSFTSLAFCFFRNIDPPIWYDTDVKLFEIQRV